MKKILVLAPHADDEILGCGGTIAKYSKLGSKVYVSILTNANIGAEELFSKNLIKKVRNEALQANELLNVKNLNFSELPAPRLDQYPIYKISNLIQKKIKKFKPDTVFIPSEKDIHTDHKIISQAALVALRPINEHKVKLILAYETLSETHWMNTKINTFSPNHFEILNSENIKQKKNLSLDISHNLKNFHTQDLLKALIY